MLLYKIFNEEQVQSIRNEILKLSFTDGKETAGGDAKKVKQNQQIVHSNSKEANHLLTTLENSLIKNNVFRTYTHFKKFVDTMVNKYETNDEYGWHYDNHLIKRERTDISFTLFLTDPKTYEGGELVIKYPHYTQKIKGEIGQIAIYPTGVVHKVNGVTQGQRLCMVGWVQSWVKDFQDREMLNLLSSQMNLLKDKIPAENKDNLKQVFQHFFRLVSS